MPDASSARLEFRLVRIAAASARSARHDDEVGLEGDDGLEVGCRRSRRPSATSAGLRSQSDSVERVVGSARRACRPRAPTCSRSCPCTPPRAAGLSHRHLGPRVVGERDRALSRCEALPGLRSRGPDPCRAGLGLRRSSSRRAASRRRGDAATAAGTTRRETSFTGDPFDEMS